MCTENVIQSNLDGQCEMLKALGVSQTAVKMFHGNGVKMKGLLECDTIK